LVKADVATMERVGPVVGRHAVQLAVDLQTPACDTVRITADQCAEISPGALRVGRISSRVVPDVLRQGTKTQDNVPSFTAPVREQERLDYPAEREDRDLRPSAVHYYVAEDFLSSHPASRLEADLG
jgi:hypothetical protein